MAKLITPRIATLFFSTLQALVYTYESYLFYMQSEYDYFNFFLLISAFTAGMGFYGIYGVVTKNVKLIKMFSAYFWLEFYLYLTSCILFALIGFGAKNQLCSFFEMEKQTQFCLDNWNEFYYVCLIIMGVISLVRYHFCKSVSNYYKELVHDHELIRYVKEATHYPKFVYVGDVKDNIKV